MSTYNLIQDGESGLLVRTTLNQVIESANSGFTSVYYQQDANTFPSGGKSGDVLIITNDGTSGGTASQEWIYNGSDWTEVGTAGDFLPITGGTITGDLTVTGNTNLNTLTSKNSTINGNLTVTGTTSVGSLTSTASTVNGNLTVTGNSNLKALTATTTNINGNLTVTGTTNISTLISTASTVNGNLTVTGTTNLAALTATTTNINGNLTVTGSTSVGSLTSTASTVNGNLTVTGTTSVGSLTSTASTVNGNLTVTGTTSVGSLTSTASTVNGNLTVTGTTNLAALTATTTNINGNLTVTGTTSVRSLTSTASTVNGNLTVTGTTSVGSLTATTLNITSLATGTSVNTLGITSGGLVVPSDAISPTTGSWTLTTGANTVSFTVSQGSSYVMWVNGNVPNGIVNWNATVTLSNANVPVIGVQYGWYYLVGNALALTSIPVQIVGTAGAISTSAPAVSNSNTFTFGITNNSGSSQIVNYGYIKIS